MPNRTPATIESKQTAPLGPFCSYDFAAAEGKPFVRLRGAGVTAHAALANPGWKTSSQVKRPDQVCESCWRVSRASPVPVTEIACHHNKVLATWHAETDDWTYQHRVARKRPTQKQSEQLAQMFDQASAATRRRDER